VLPSPAAAGVDSTSKWNIIRLERVPGLGGRMLGFSAHGGVALWDCVVRAAFSPTVQDFPSIPPVQITGVFIASCIESIVVSSLQLAVEHGLSCPQGFSIQLPLCTN